MTIIKKMAVLLYAAVILALFLGLRLDGSDRHYFSIDDLVVVQLVDRARSEQHWQPDWYAASDPAQISTKRLHTAKAELERLQANHVHHYNFAGHISLSSAIAVAIDALGIPFDSTRLLRALAVLWDSLSLLLLSCFCYKVLGARAAMIAALCYSVLPLAVQSSHYARPDALLGLQAVAVIYLSYSLLALPHTRAFFIRCAAIGALLAFAVATKASSLLYGIFPLAAFLYSLSQHQRGLTELVLAGAVLILSLLALLACYFYLVDISWSDFFASTQSIQRYYQAPLPPDIRYDPTIWGHVKHFGNYLVGSLGWLWLIIAAIGSAALFTTQRALFVTAVIPTALLTGYYLCQAVFFDRSLLVLMPVLCLLAAAGAVQLTHYRYSNNSAVALLLGLCLVWPAVQLSWALQRHIGKSISDARYSYQQQLLQQLRQQTQVQLWLKWINRADIASNQLPQLNNAQPRLYVVEHFNDPQSDRYLALLEQHGWQRVGYYQGDFSHLPTNSLHIAHEAAHFYYFIDPAALASFQRSSGDHLSK